MSETTGDVPGQRPLMQEEHDRRLTTGLTIAADRVEAIGRLFGRKGPPDWTLTQVRLTCCWSSGSYKDGSPRPSGFSVDWQSVSAGCGRIDVLLDASGRVSIDTQACSKDFVKSVLSRLVDDAELVG